MKKERFVLAFFTGCLISAVSLQAQTGKDSTKVARSYAINEVVVTGTRSETDVRHLPMTVSVVGRPQLEASQQTSVLPVLNSQVPGFFSTSRGVMGYGVATGASGQINDGYQPGGEPLQYRFNSNDQMLGVSWYQSVQLFQGNRLTVGADYFHFGGEAWNQFFDGHRETSANKSLNEVAGYVDFRQDIAAWLTLDAGARVDYHSQTGTEFIPQVGLAFHLPENAEIKAMASKGFRNPTIREMYMFPPQNPDLKPEKLWNYELSFSQRLMDNRLSYGLNVFYINGENLIIRLPNPNGSGMLNQNSGEIENWGAEANVGYQFNPVWSVMANYSWLHMENPVLASPEHKLYGGVNFRKGRWSASTGIQYVKGLYTDLDAATKENFVLWDMQGSFKATNYLSFYVRGENLLAQRYEINAGYPMPKATFMGGVNINF